jgi:hypothetical protein
MTETEFELWVDEYFKEQLSLMYQMECRKLVRYFSGAPRSARPKVKGYNPLL